MALTAPLGAGFQGLPDAVVKVLDPQTGHRVIVGDATYVQAVQAGAIDPSRLQDYDPEIAAFNPATQRHDMIIGRGYSRGMSPRGMSPSAGAETYEVTNPLTGRRIRVGGLEYNQLVQNGQIDPNNLAALNPQPAIISPYTGRAEMVGGRSYEQPEQGGRVSPRGASLSYTGPTRYHGQGYTY